MASQQTLILLVRSLSRSEKRYFKLFTSLQEGSKYYLSLFELFENEKADPDDIKSKFSKKHPGIAWDSACKHLYKVLMRCLRSFDSDNKIEFKLGNLYQDIRVLYDKQIFEEFLFQTKKLKELALKYEKYSFYSLAVSLELEYYTRKDFLDLSEQHLVDLQQSVEDVLDRNLVIRKHSALYELLLYRFVHKGVVRSQEEKIQLNDLALTESQIVMDPRYNSFEANKLHLLFQSVYFKITGEPELSLDIYRELDELFEKNKVVWQDSPVYYMYMLEGVVRNLLQGKRFESVPYFMGRLTHLGKSLPGLESQLVSLLIELEVKSCIVRGDCVAALNVLEKYEEQVRKRNAEFTPNEKARISLASAMAYMENNQLKMALSFLNKMMDIGEKLLIPELFVTGRLVRMIVHYEMNNYEYLNYDIRSFERHLRKKGRFYKTEKLVVGLLKKNINTIDKSALKGNYTDAIRFLKALENYPLEMQLNSVYDFVSYFTRKVF